MQEIYVKLHYVGKMFAILIENNLIVLPKSNSTTKGSGKPLLCPGHA